MLPTNKMITFYHLAMGFKLTTSMTLISSNNHYTAIHSRQTFVAGSMKSHSYCNLWNVFFAQLIQFQSYKRQRTLYFKGHLGLQN